MGSYYSRPDTAANREKFTWAGKATTYDNLLLDGRISNADVRFDDGGGSGLHWIPWIGRQDEWKGVIVTDMLLSYLLTCDPPADVNGRDRRGYTPMWKAAYYTNTSAVKVLIDFGGDRTIKTNSDAGHPNTTPLDIAKEENNQETIELLTECFPFEE